jgi:hypothetical protein
LARLQSEIARHGGDSKRRMFGKTRAEMLADTQASLSALEAGSAPPPARPSPATTSAPAPAPEAALETRSSAPARAVTETPAAPAAGQAARDRSVESASRSPTPEVAADIAGSMREAEADQRRAVMAVVPGEAYSSEAAAPDPERAPASVAQPSAADWAARIAALHSSGDLAGAASVLREFRATDPDADARLPESLHEWARTVELPADRRPLRSMRSARAASSLKPRSASAGVSA